MPLRKDDIIINLLQVSKLTILYEQNQMKRTKGTILIDAQ